jgi:transcriptional regulator with XRE-family HTH domain
MVDVPQFERVTQQRRDAPDLGLEHVSELRARQIGVRCVRYRRDRSDDRDFAGFLKADVTPSPRLPQAHEALIDNDAREPCSEAAAALEAVDVLERSRECVMRLILGVSSVPQDGSREAHGHVPVPADQLPESVDPARLREDHKFFIGEQGQSCSVILHRELRDVIDSVSVPMNDAPEYPRPEPQADETHFSDAEQKPQRFSYTEATLPQEDSRATIERVLSGYELGSKLRQLRLRKKIGLADLGRHTGLSPSMISQLENGKLIPTLPTLARIAMVFDVGLDHFFTPKRKGRPFSIVRADEPITFPEKADKQKPAYFFQCLAFAAQEKSLQAYIAEFPRRQTSEVEEHNHDGAEFLHVLEGSIEIRHGGEPYELKAGDSVYFDSSELHSYRGVSRAPARALVITTAPRL